VSRKGPSVQRRPAPPLDSPPPARRECARLCSVGRHLLTSLSPLHPLLPPDTPGERLIRRGIDSPCEPRRALHAATHPCHASRDLHRALRLTNALRPATRTVLTSCGLRLAWRPALRPRYNLYPPRPHSPLTPRLSYNI
jgi:hypothetical protein